MSAEGVRLAISRIADDLLALAVLVLEDDTISVNIKVGKNTLKDSALKQDLFVRISEAIGDDAVIGAMFNNYVGYIEWDRPPKYGRQPPIDALKNWAAKNNIPTDANTLWAISYAIWRDGHAGRPIFATIDRYTDQLFTDWWADSLLAAVVDNLEQYFND